MTTPTTWEPNFVGWRKGRCRPDEMPFNPTIEQRVSCLTGGDEGATTSQILAHLRLPSHCRNLLVLELRRAGWVKMRPRGAKREGWQPPRGWKAVRTPLVIV